MQFEAKYRQRKEIKKNIHISNDGKITFVISDITKEKMINLFTKSYAFFCCSYCCCLVVSVSVIQFQYFNLTKKRQRLKKYRNAEKKMKKSKKGETSK